MSDSDMIGKKYGRLTVLYKLPYKNSGGNILFKCRCDCGNFSDVSGSQLRTGKTKSCGCLVREILLVANTTHGMSKTKEYFIWKTMKQRCLNKKSPDFYLYGGRGIGICRRWLNSFKNFYDDIGKIPKDMTLDRIDNDGDYCPENCRLISNKKQSLNKRTNRYVEYKGYKKTLSEWEEITGFGHMTIWRRLDSGWSVEDCLEIIPKKGGHYDKTCERRVPIIR